MYSLFLSLVLFVTNAQDVLSASHSLIWYVPDGDAISHFSGEFSIPALHPQGCAVWIGIAPTDNSWSLQNILEMRSGKWDIWTHSTFAASQNQTSSK